MFINFAITVSMTENVKSVEPNLQQLEELEPLIRCRLIYVSSLGCCEDV